MIPGSAALPHATVPSVSNTMNSNNTEPRIAAGSQTAAGSNGVGAEIAGASGPATPAFTCHVCSRVFATKIGVGVHVSSAHRPQANDQIVVDRVKARWPQEERRLFALNEAKLVFGGIASSGIKRELCKNHQGRTQESIKGRRRTKEHRDLVAMFLASLQGTLAT